jgi:RNA polymerase sigma-70 factor (ECF subfamily)
MSRLPDKWAACFSLKVIGEEITESVCKELDITPSNLWVILHRARLQLRECMEKQWFK